MNLGLTVGVGGLGLLLCGGALLWARGRDPFQRDWFSLPVAGQGRVQCVAVLPKNAPRPYPVVVYLHGAGGNVRGDGNDLRQMAELGLAAVGMDYCQTNDMRSEAQFAALLRHLGRRRWADTNAVAWIGFSLGAEKVTRFWLKHPEARPALLVRVAGGWMAELEKFEGRNSRANGDAAGTRRPEPRTSDAARGSFPNARPAAVLLLHGDQDTVFPVADAERVATAFRAHGVPVELKVLPGQGHRLNPDRDVWFRVVGEYCLTQLRGQPALAQYRSIGAWQAGAWPLWLYWLPAWVWGGLWWWRKRSAARTERLAEREPGDASGAGELESVGPKRRTRTRGERAVRWLAAALALLALGLSAVHLGAPRLMVSERTLAVARRFLVQPPEREDFEHLASQPCWRGQRLGALLEHAHLARYNRGLVNWTQEDALYREFVLAPVIEAGGTEDLGWRRPLWESLYPRVRKETSVAEAAQTVVRHLRERVTIAEGDDWPGGIVNLWRRQITNRRGFERLTVAGLRSVGIAARLAHHGQAEMFAGGEWKPVPRPFPGDDQPGP